MLDYGNYIHDKWTANVDTGLGGAAVSHITRIKTRMVEKSYLLDALKDLGYSVKENAKLKTFFLTRTDVDIKVSGLALGTDVGFVKQASGYEIVADWWSVRKVAKEDFTKQVVQLYAYHAAKDQLEKQGFSLVEENVDQQQRIRLVLRRTA